MTSFIERFKGKINVINRDGTIKEINDTPIPLFYKIKQKLCNQDKNKDNLEFSSYKNSIEGLKKPESRRIKIINDKSTSRFLLFFCPFVTFILQINLLLFVTILKTQTSWKQIHIHLQSMRCITVQSLEHTGLLNIH